MKRERGARIHKPSRGVTGAKTKINHQDGVKGTVDEINEFRPGIRHDVRSCPMGRPTSLRLHCAASPTVLPNPAQDVMPKGRRTRTATRRARMSYLALLAACGLLLLAVFWPESITMSWLREAGLLAMRVWILSVTAVGLAVGLLTYRDNIQFDRERESWRVLITMLVLALFSVLGAIMWLYCAGSLIGSTWWTACAILMAEVGVLLCGVAAESVYDNYLQYMITSSGRDACSVLVVGLDNAGKRRY